MNYKIVHTLALLFAGLLFCFSVSGQTLESGRKLYNDKKYAEAADIFEVLIKKLRQTPNSINGTVCRSMNSANTNKPKNT